MLTIEDIFSKKKKKIWENIINKHSLVTESLMLLTKCYSSYIKINEDEITILISGTQNWFSSSDLVCELLLRSHFL